MPSLHPYLNFPGTTEEAFLFYKSVFGGEFLMVQRYADTPEKEKLSPADHQKIMHIALPIGGTILMGTDALPSMGFTVQNGNNLHLSISADSLEESQKLFNGLAAGGGTITMPFEKAFWGAYFGMLTDKFGILWMVNFDDK